MKRHDAERQSEERLKLLEMEANLQRASLAATLENLQKRRALAWGGKAATWGLRLLAMPQVRWLITANILTRLKRKWAR